MKVAVLGAGITGVTVSHLLAEKGHEVSCLEMAARPGGLCGSETIDGFVVDKAGGHIIFSRDQEVMDFVLGTLGEGGYHTVQRQTSIVHDRRLVQYPFENGLADLANDETYSCLVGYINAWHERKNGAEEPQNFKDWCLWRFGPGICETFMHPYNEKIWNIPLEEMGIQWVSGRVPDAPMEDVVRSALGIRTEGYTHQSVFHYPLEGGFETIVTKVAERLPKGCLELNTRVASLEKTGEGFLVNGRPFDRVVSTLPLPELLSFGGMQWPAEVHDALSSLDHTSLATVFLALKRPDLPPHSWLYFPHASQGPQNRVTYLSNYSPRNAPDGCSSMMAEVTYHGAAPADDVTLSEQVVQGLADSGLLDPSEVLWTRTWHNRYAYILYRHGLEEALATIRGHMQHVGLDIVGRFGNYNYFNSDMCIRSAMDLVRERYPS